MKGHFPIFRNHFNAYKLIYNQEIFTYILTNEKMKYPDISDKIYTFPNQC